VKITSGIAAEGTGLLMGINSFTAKLYQKTIFDIAPLMWCSNKMSYVGSFMKTIS
jgi:hypothetical protein